MANTKIKALIGFSDGEISMYVGEIRDVDSTKATAFISGGLAVEYTDPINPTGSVTLDANGTYDVTDKASAIVNVSVATVTYNVNGGSGEIANATAIKGNTIDLNNGATITPPTNFEFVGWNTSASATEAISNTYQVTGDVTLYAVYRRVSYTVTYNVNGGSGSIDPATVTVGQSVNLNDGSGLTPPSEKTFAGWATTDSAVEADVESPYTPTDDITIYAVWTA